ncbi:unnamed protein product, partial [Brugia pahangi]|uniref:Kinase n=1 Tax=Brugia pahangi TaxID=6280 RepID=A0A0N4T0N6_BRUPA
TYSFSTVVTTTIVTNERCKLQTNASSSSSIFNILSFNSESLDEFTFRFDSLRRNSAFCEEKGLVDTMAITALPVNCWLRERLNKWVQLSGHEGTIVPATDKTLWKKRSYSGCNESNAYRALMNDSALQAFVPRYYREVEYGNDSFIEIEDLTALFDDPAIMDIKMGTRTFLESELNSKIVRNDLYEKMVSLDPYEPTEEEHATKAITKMRYMQFREKKSSTATLGYRIEAAKFLENKLFFCNFFKKIKTHEDIRKTLVEFFGQHISTAGYHILQRLQRLREAVQKSLFFRTHEVIGSSLLLMYDATLANVWMIDFAKSIPMEIDSVNHRREWIFGNHEDGYFVGLDNLIKVNYLPDDFLFFYFAVFALLLLV